MCYSSRIACRKNVWSFFSTLNKISNNKWISMKLGDVLNNVIFIINAKFEQNPMIYNDLMREKKV